MAEKPALKVILTATAVDELHGIWRWNARSYSPIHADQYIRYLKRGIDGLARTHARGKPVKVRPEICYLLIRRRNRGHGHVVVYRVRGQEIHVLHVFHSAQDWPAKLAE